MNDLPLCKCGCGAPVTKITNKYLLGHTNKNRNLPESQKQKMRESRSKIIHLFIGKPLRSDIKEKMRLAHIGMPGPNKGKIFSMESRLKMSQSGKNRIHKSGYKLNLSLDERQRRKEFALNHNAMKRPEVSKKISDIKRGIPRSAETKRKLRLAQIKRVSDQYANGEPCHPTIGNNERVVLDKLEKVFNIIIERQILIDDLGYWVDGCIKDKKIFIEFDEEFHFKNSEIIQKDIDRQKEIENKTSSIFFRIRERDWLINENEVISNFRIFLESQ